MNFNFILFWIFIKLKYCFSLLYFLSNKPFNLSVIVDGASSNESKIQHFHFSIAFNKNPDFHSINSSPISFPSKFLIYCPPIISLHVKFSVQTQKYISSSFSFSLFLLFQYSEIHFANWVFPFPSLPVIITCLSFWSENNIE